MELKNVRNRDQFIEYINEHIPKDKMGSKTTADTADWFVACVDARMVFDSYTTKDLASAFLDGFPAIRNNEKSHTEFFNTFFEEMDLCLNDGEIEDAADHEKDAIENLTTLLNEHFALN